TPNVSLAVLFTAAQRRMANRARTSGVAAIAQAASAARSEGCESRDAPMTVSARTATVKPPASNHALYSGAPTASTRSEEVGPGTRIQTVRKRRAAAALNTNQETKGTIAPSCYHPRRSF